MSKKKICLVCPSCKVCEINLKDCFFFCNECNVLYKVKDIYPILINFGLENDLIKENEIRVKKNKIKTNTLKKKILDFLYEFSKATKNNKIKFLERMNNNYSKNILVTGGATKGSGAEKLSGNNQIEIISLDLMGTENFDYFTDTYYLSFKEETFVGVWIQVVLEHVVSPETVGNEIYSLLKTDGLIYSEIPFIKQIDVGKNDFTRYILKEHRFLSKKKFEKVDVGINGGPVVSFSCSLKNFIWAFTNEKKANTLTIIDFFILKFFDELLSKRSSWYGHAGSYFFGKKNGKFRFDKEELNQIYMGKQI